MRSLRTRLILSHVVPLLIVIPILGIALTYLLETQVLLAQFSNELELQAALVAEAAAQNPLIWYDPLQAAAFVGRIGARLSARIMLLDPQGTLLATNDMTYREQLGEVLEIPELEETVTTGIGRLVNYGERGTAAASVLMPVLTPAWELGSSGIISGSWRVVGVIRLTDPLSSVYERFPRTRTFILWVLVGGLVIGVLVGWILAFDLERPLRRATQAITQMTGGKQLMALPEQGPTEVRLLVRAFNTLTAQLQSLEKSRQRLLANLVHEIGRPLGALLSATQALASGAADDPELRHELLGGIEGEVRRMRYLLDDLTRLYDQAAGTPELAHSPTPLATWLPEVLSPWREAAQAKSLEWEVTYPEDLPVLSLDPDRMAQALGNVVSNAIKYTPTGGTIRIDAGQNENGVWVRVQDTGPGIPAEEQARIFEPFYRGPASQRFPQGMGLGLSIARDLVQAHGGRIEVESEIGAGSTFTLWIPDPKSFGFTEKTGDPTAETQRSQRF
ncbi:MAG: HAMP domain-containing histidine kinase [Anaerolineae bacterium]|nr:HAMP domain-containing histidine kinase [Anaerolineae bacterium]